jgi:DNA-binding Lrp family transcriptional regulator
MSQADLARMLGASRSKLNTELRRLEEANILRLGYRRMYLRDCERLGMIAGTGVPML